MRFWFILKIITTSKNLSFALVFSRVLIFIPFASCLCKAASKGRRLRAKARVKIRIKTKARVEVRTKVAFASFYLYLSVALVFSRVLIFIPFARIFILNKNKKREIRIKTKARVEGWRATEVQRKARGKSGEDPCITSFAPSFRCLLQPFPCTAYLELRWGEKNIKRGLR